MMITLCPGFFVPFSVPPKSIEIDASFGAVVGVVTLGIETVGRVTAGGAGAALAAVSEPLSHEHVNANIGSAITTSSRRRQLFTTAALDFDTGTLQGPGMLNGE
jgi:hypothetical protein